MKGVIDRLEPLILLSYFLHLAYFLRRTVMLILFLISNFRLVLNVVCFLLCNSPASTFYMPTFRNTLSVPSSWADRYEEILYTYPPIKMEQTEITECSETSPYKIQTPENYPEESIHHANIDLTFL
jgi:hypothetical protein